MAEEHLLPPEAMPYFGLFVALALIAGMLFIRNASTNTVETTREIASSSQLAHISLHSADGSGQ